MWPNGSGLAGKRLKSKPRVHTGKTDGSAARATDAELLDFHFLNLKIAGLTPFPLSSKFYHFMTVMGIMNYKLAWSLRMALVNSSQHTDSGEL